MAVPDRQSGDRPADRRRPVLLAPVDRLLSRWPTSVRLAALVILLVLPAAIANVAFAQTITGQLDFSLAERDGVQVLRPALTAMATTVAGRTPDLSAVETAVNTQPGLALSEKWQAVQAAGEKLGAGSGSTDAAAARTTLVSALADLVTEAGNTSNLILDPDLDSFYVMDTLVVQVPRMLLTAAQGASPDGTASRTDQVATQAVRAGTLAGSVAAITSDLKTATDNTADTALAGRLEAMTGATFAGNALANRLTSTLAAPAAADPAAVGAATVTALPDTVTALDALLVTRTDKLAQRRLVTLVITLAALAVACWFAAGFWWRTRNDVALVLGAVTAIAEGDLEARQVPEGHEEFGRIGRALAVARHELGQARQALTASERARSEQTRRNFAQLRAAERQARERAQEIIDSTAGTVVTELSEVVQQVEAVRVTASTIDDRVGTADTATRSVVEQAQEAERLVTALSGSLHKVADMAQLIGGIADQTRLLALNATIESARAGEAGRGFSVVAQEVKNLAVTTARSTGQITQTIGSLQRDAEAVTSAISQMGQSILGVDEATAVLADVATEQHSLVERLDQCVSGAMDRVHSMTELAEKLERRHFERLPTVSPVRLRLDGRDVEAHATDVSLGGVRCTVTGDRVPADGATLELVITRGSGPISVTARVVHVEQGDGGTDVGMEFVNVQPDVMEMLADYLESVADPDGLSASRPS